MITNNIKQLSYIKKKELIKNMFINYKSLVIIRDTKLKTKQSDDKISVFEKIIAMLNKENRYLIWESFYYDKRYNDKDSFYSKSTYYKRHHAAVDAFLALFYA